MNFEVAVSGRGLPHVGRVVQYGYVVDDLDRGMARWRALVPLGPFYLIEHVKVVDGSYRGAPMELEMSAALAQAGDIQVELLVQHSPGPSALTDLGGNRRATLNHFGIVSEDIERDIAFLEGQGHQTAMRGLVLGAMPFAYVDTSAVLGHMLELVPARADLLAMFAEVARAAKDWNGMDPVRRFQ